MPVYFCRSCRQDAGSQSQACLRCGAHPRLPRGGRETLELSRAASEAEASKRRSKVSTEEAVRRAKNVSTRRRELRKAAEPRRVAKRGYLSEAQILDLWQGHHGKLSKRLIRQFLAHPRLSQLLSIGGKFVRRAIQTSNKLEEIAENALQASREEEELRKRQEECRREQSRVSRVDWRDLALGPIARTWITHRQNEE